MQLIDSPVIFISPPRIISFKVNSFRYQQALRCP
jgi:hypothetical protein